MSQILDVVAPTRLLRGVGARIRKMQLGSKNSAAIMQDHTLPLAPIITQGE